MFTEVKDNNLLEELNKLEAERDQKQIIIGQAQAELDEAKASQKLTGQYIDASHFADLKTTVRDETTELHNINRRIKHIRSLMNKSNPSASYFQQAAQVILDQDTFVKISQLADDMMRKSN